MYSNRSVLATSDTSTGYPFGLWLLVELCDVQLKDFLRPQVFRRNHSHLLGAHLLILYAPSNGASGSEFWCDCSCARSYDGHRLIRTNEPMETLRSPRKSVHLVDGYKAPRRSKSPRPLPACIPRRLERMFDFSSLRRYLLQACSLRFHHSP